METLDLTPALINIDFVKRYMALCEENNDFDNSLRGNNVALYKSLMHQFPYDIKYDSRESFFRTTELMDSYTFVFTLTLKDGIVEPMLHIKSNDIWFSPGGRFDFIPEKMGLEFNRKIYNLPKYGSEEQLKSILETLFKIYEDVKNEVLRKFPTTQ